MLVSHQHWIKVLTINNYLVANLALIRKHSFYLFYFTLFYFIILYWFCHTSTWVRHRCTCVPNPEPPSQLPPRTISLGHPSGPAPSILYPASNLDWRFVSYMILYMFQQEPLWPTSQNTGNKCCLIILISKNFNQEVWI